MAHAEYVQVAGEPQVTSAGGMQPDRAPPEENKAFGWVRRLPDALVPSSWKAAGRTCGRKEMAAEVHPAACL